MLKIDWNPTDRLLRQFGWISLFGFAAIGLVLRWTVGAPLAVTLSLAGFGLLVLVLSLINQRLVGPIYIGMTIIALPIGFVVSHVLLALLYYGMFTPVGLLFRAFGRDPLAKSPDPAVVSYWHVRKAPRPPRDYFKLY